MALNFIEKLVILIMDGWINGWMDGWVGRGKSRFKDCLQQSKIISFLPKVIRDKNEKFKSKNLIGVIISLTSDKKITTSVLIKMYEFVIDTPFY